MTRVAVPNLKRADSTMCTAPVSSKVWPSYSNRDWLLAWYISLYAMSH